MSLFKTAKGVTNPNFKLCFWLYFILAISTITPAASYAQTNSSYEIDGEIQLLSYDLSGSLKKTQNGSFQVTIQETNWFIHSQLLNDPTCDYIETGKDAGNIYSLWSLEKSRKKKIEKGEKVGINSSVGFVQKGNVPSPLNAAHNAVIWLGLASGSYLKDKPPSSSNTIAPVFISETHYLAQTPYEMQTQWILSSNTPVFPDRIVYFADGFFRKWNDPESALYEPPKLLKRLKPFDNGYTNAIYQTASWTNVNNLGTFPLEGVFLRYFPKIDGDTASDILLIEKTVLIVKEVKATPARPTWKPENHGLSHVTDQRFITASNVAISFNYLLTNQWLSDNEAITNKEFLKQVEYHKQRKPHFLSIKDKVPTAHAPKKINPLYFITFFFATAIPLALAMIKTKKQK